jgi:hypothetical protein
VDGGQLIGDRQAVGADLRRAELEQLLEAGDPDLEELIQIARGDAQELQPLEQWHARIQALRQHPLIELQRGDLAIDEVLR